MNNNIRVGVGFLVPAVAIIAFFSSILVENYLLGIFFAIAGVLVWFLYAAIMQSELPDVTGNVIIVFGFLLSSAVLLKYGWEQNMFGGFVFNLEGAMLSAVLLFFSVLLGVLFQNSHPSHHLSSNKPVSSEPQAPPVKSTVDSVVEDYQTSEDDEYDGYNSEAYEAYCSDYYDYYNEDGGGE